MNRTTKSIKEEKHFSIINFIRTLFFVITIPLLIIAIIILYKANKYPDKIPDVFGIKPMIVLSGSMEGTIHTGDLVFVKEIDTNTLKVNDIIAFRNEENKVTTHRIIEIIENSAGKFFKTKGDANNSEDANLVKLSDVEGIYLSRISGVGSFLMFMQQPIGLAIVLLVILVIGLILLQIANKMDDRKLSKEEEEERKEFLEYKKMKEQQKNNEEK